jgi:3'-phosphoadenosine 5'-phosphosulfate sulfotransferase (PAPS reductase)/FAD synthetase
MTHVVFFSGGIGSFFTAKRVIEKHGKENVVLLFTDTLIEDDDLYRFMDDASKFFDVPVTKIADGRTPWQVFKDVRWLGNSRLAQCSHILKQKTAETFIKANFNPEECTLYLVLIGQKNTVQRHLRRIGSLIKWSFQCVKNRYIER